MALVISALMVAVGFSAAPAYAAATSTFDEVSPRGETSGSFTWHNRSISVQGSVCDYYGGNGSTTAVFQFYLTRDGAVPDNSIFYAEQTRTTNGSCRSFNFTQEGPPGGIQSITVQVCHPSMACYINTYNRP